MCGSFNIVVPTQYDHIHWPISVYFVHFLLLIKVQKLHRALLEENVKVENTDFDRRINSKHLQSLERPVHMCSNSGPANSFHNTVTQM